MPGELDPAARTRLGLDGIELELPQGIVSVFGHLLARLNLPAWMLPAVPDDGAAPLIEGLQTQPQRLAFSVRGRRFLYDRMGLRSADSEVA